MIGLIFGGRRRFRRMYHTAHEIEVERYQVRWQKMNGKSAHDGLKLGINGGLDSRIKADRERQFSYGWDDRKAGIGPHDSKAASTGVHACSSVRAFDVRVLTREVKA